jgi:catechol 2,3-dioxygenase-like lactoylglutathione lyase family enzyme
VRDVVASRRFYEDLLGQMVLMDHGLNVAFAGFAIWQADHAARTIFGAAPTDSTRLGRDNLEVYFESAEIESLLATLTSAGVEIIHAIKEEDWGQRTLRVRDPDGNVVEFGEPMPLVIRRFVSHGMTHEEIARRVAMPVEVVGLMAKENRLENEE